MTPRHGKVVHHAAIGRFEVLERAGHIPMMEVPDEFNRLVDGFAREVLKANGRKRRSA